MAKGKSNQPAGESTTFARMMLQGWVSVALWMSAGLLLEGLLGYKIPSYLNDLQRRELFRLAHTHGTFLGLVLIVAALCAHRGATLPRAASLSLSVGAALMPLGFLLAGIWHPEGDPGPAIWIVPPSALLIIFGAVTLALAHSKRADSSD
ncbi:MAG TPA: hypothetical protein VNI02_16685 [Blastocatellia bacterium]|nr:hypothetical protein [Blastocatellia bacterium]